MYKVLIADRVSQEALQVFEEYEQIQVSFQPDLSQEELFQELPQYDGIIIRSRIKLQKELLSQALSLKVIGRAGIGVDNIDLDEASRLGIVVINTPDSSAITTAEHTLALMLSLVRKVPQGTMSLKAGEWKKNELMGRELYQKTLGILGLGNIGRRVAERAKGLFMRVIACDPYMSEQRARELGVELVSFEELLRRSDILTCHVPLTEATRHILNKKTLSQMKPGSFLINCARGGIVDEKALYSLLKEGHLAGAALDVFEEEPPPKDHPLLSLDNVICTPHLGASTEEAQANIARTIAHAVAKYLVYGEVTQALNFPAVPGEMRKVLEPYLYLGEKLGRLAGQLLPTGWKKLQIFYEGKVRELSTKHISRAIEKGLLDQHHRGTLNYVNAPYLLKEHGIVVEEIQKEGELFTSSILVRLEAHSAEVKVRGTLGAHGRPRVVEVNECPVEFVPEGVILVMENEDKPGVIGNVGSLLGERGINITGVQLGLHPRTGKALSFWQVSQEIPEEVLRKMEKFPHIFRVEQVKL